MIYSGTNIKRYWFHLNSVRNGPREVDDWAKHLLTGNVGLPGEDGVLEFVRHHRKFIIRCPVDSDGVVGRRAQLLPYARSVGSYEGQKEASLSNFPANMNMSSVKNRTVNYYNKQMHQLTLFLFIGFSLWKATLNYSEDWRRSFRSTGVLSNESNTEETG